MYHAYIVTAHILLYNLYTDSLDLKANHIVFRNVILQKQLFRKVCFNTVAVLSGVSLYLSIIL
jgi:hypothetical protein